MTETKRTKLIITTNAILTKAVYVLYPILIAFLAIAYFIGKDFAFIAGTRMPVCLPAVLVPGISFVIVSVFRNIYDAPRPYDISNVGKEDLGSVKCKEGIVSAEDKEDIRSAEDKENVGSAWDKEEAGTNNYKIATPIIKKDAPGKSFPSRHIFSIFIISVTYMWAGYTLGLVGDFLTGPAGIMGFVIEVLGVLIAIAGILLAIVRVKGGVHFPRDVIAGAIMGIACGGLGYWITNLLC